jgi:prepilin-type N-terminal cleavage/methylation domain-containing protein
MIQALKNRLAESKRDEEGFTLIELLIVIVILGILAAVVVLSVGGISNKGEESACKAELNTLRTAQEANFAKNAGYAADNAALVTAGFLSDDETKYFKAIAAAPHVAKLDPAATLPGTCSL